jgi:hypothetical protein
MKSAIEVDRSLEAGLVFHRFGGARQAGDLERVGRCRETSVGLLARETL